MGRAGIRIASAGLLLLVLASAAVGQTYDLRKAPKFQPGDTATCRTTGREEITLADRDGKVLKTRRLRLEFTLDQEVLATDAAGQATVLRCTLRSGSGEVVLRIPGRGEVKKTVTLKRLTVLARRKGRNFVVDMSTLTSPEMARLTVPQRWLLKKIFEPTVSFGAHSAAHLALLPARPVRAGQSWRPATKDIQQWLRENRSSRHLSPRPVRAEMKLVSVEGDVATIRGTIRLRGRLGKLQIAPEMDVMMRIDLASGRRLAGTCSARFSGSREGVALRYQARGKTVTRFTPGTGRARAAPPTAYRLGWHAPAADANNYRNARHGLSLNLPAGYAPSRGGAGSPSVARFSSPHGGSIIISAEDADYPLTMNELTEQVLSGIHAALKDYRLVQRRDLLLPGGVPAALLLGRFRNGSVTLMTLVAADGTRLLSVTAGAPTDKTDVVEEIRKIVLSLRVFEPEPAPRK